MRDAGTLQRHSSVPVASWLGYAGLLPFVVGALLTWLLPPEARPVAAAALAAYAAVIVSFLGGIHWGIGMRDAAPRLLAWAVVPSLAAAAALLLPPRLGLPVHALMLLVCLAFDRRVYPAHGLRAWLPLRWRLSLVAALACLVAAVPGWA